MHTTFRLLIICPILFLVGCQKNMEPADFQQLSLPSTPNYYLVAPKGYEPKPNQISPIFAVSKDILAQKLHQSIMNEPRITLIKEDRAGLKYSYIQRTFFFRFPDQIDIQYIDVGTDKSSFYLISRSHYGYSDLGKNKKRIKEWLKKWHSLELSD